MFFTKRTVIGILVAMLVIVLATPVFAGGNITVEVNGSKVNFPDQKPFIDSDTNRTYVPLRFVSEALGGSVDWDGQKQIATVDRNGKHIEMKIGSNKPTVDGKTKYLDAPARLVNSRTVVPLRFVSEALGAKVEWIAETRTVIITDTQGGGDDTQGGGDEDTQPGTPRTPDTPAAETRPFSGEPLNPDDYVAYDGWAVPYEFKQPGASIMYLTVEELKKKPVKMGNSGWTIIYDINVQEDMVYVKQASGDFIPAVLVLAKGNDVSVQRANTFVKYNKNPFTHSYYVSLEADPGGGTKIEDVTHIMILFSNQVLAIENPLYKGGN